MSRIERIVESSILFYPCSGKDFAVPIQLFAPYVGEFWFADLTYFTERSAEQGPPILDDPGYRLLDVQIDGPPLARMQMLDGHPEMEPCVRSEYYQHIHTRDIIAVHRRRGFAVSTLRKLISSLTVFFYRGDDGDREYGSQVRWLTTRHNRIGLIDEVLDRLIDGGLFVTDGSNCYRSRNPYAPLAQFRNQYLSWEAAKQAQPFETQRARFECVGYAGYRYGPTLIWQVWKK